MNNPNQINTNYPINTNKYQLSNNGERNREKRFDIHDRIFNFVIRVLKFIKYIPKTPENLIIVPQLTRSVTSTGANDQEADGVSTNRDFIHCFTTVRKELKETKYWLRVIAALNEQLASKMNGMLQENKELIDIISTIIRNSTKKRK